MTPRKDGVYLKIMDIKVECINTIFGIDDFGSSGTTFRCVEFENGSHYVIRPDGYIKSETSCCFIFNKIMKNFSPAGKVSGIKNVRK